MNEQTDWEAQQTSHLLVPFSRVTLEETAERTGRSAYGSFRAPQCHLEQKLPLIWHRLTRAALMSSSGPPQVKAVVPCLDRCFPSLEQTAGSVQGGMASDRPACAGQNRCAVHWGARGGDM